MMIDFLKTHFFDVSSTMYQHIFKAGRHNLFQRTCSLPGFHGWTSYFGTDGLTILALQINCCEKKKSRLRVCCCVPCFLFFCNWSRDQINYQTNPSVEISPCSREKFAGITTKDNKQRYNRQEVGLRLDTRGGNIFFPRHKSTKWR
jgi:hypothetical protein